MNRVKKKCTMKKWLSGSAILLSIFAIFGCSPRNLYFGTASYIGLDVSGTAQVPNSVSVGYGRAEAAYVPNKSDGSAHSVIGSIDSDLTWFKGQRIKQIFATGEAAQEVAGNGEAMRVDQNCQKETLDVKAPLYFGTIQIFGLDLSVGGKNVAPGLTLGYKRAEATIIPIVNPSCEVRSVYADISIDSTSQTEPHTNGTAGSASEQALKALPSEIEGVRIVQRFATGNAAITLSANGDIKKKVMAAVSPDSLGNFANKATIEKEIIDSMDKLNTVEQNKVLDWADNEFKGRLNQKTVKEFEFGLLPNLTDNERQQVLDYIKQQSQQ